MIQALRACCRRLAGWDAKEGPVEAGGRLLTLPSPPTYRWADRETHLSPGGRYNYAIHKEKNTAPEAPGTIKIELITLVEKLVALGVEEPQSALRRNSEELTTQAAEASNPLGLPELRLEHLGGEEEVRRPRQVHVVPGPVQKPEEPPDGGVGP